MSTNSTAEGGPSAGDAHHGNATGGVSPGNSTAGGHGGGKFGTDPARLAMFHMRQLRNEDMVQYMAASLCGLIAIFVFFHWTRLLVSKTRLSTSPVARPFVLASRLVRNVLVRSCPGFNSAGHGLLVFVYVAVNFAMIFNNVDTKTPGNQASRFGWVLISNMCFVVFLSLKNTPLAFLTSYSYERLNNLHQIAGCTTFLLMVMHAVVYTVFFWRRDQLYILREREQIAGIISGFGFLSLVVTAIFLRRYTYETFYAMHVTSFVVSIVCVGFHRPDFMDKTAYITCITAAMFGADRLVRLTRWFIYSTNNEASVYPLPNGGTRIIMTKRPAMAVPGKHCFVWLPKIRLLEMHPFTIISTKPMEFVVKEYNGFTRDLHAYAAAHPGAKLKCSVEGPYGTFPDPMGFDKVVLIAGGSGASYTFGLAVNLLERMGPESTKEIVFIWTAKTHANLTWFTEHLNTLRTHSNAPKVHVSLWVTRAPSSSSSGEHLTLSLQGPLRLHTVESQESVHETASHDTEKGLHEHHEELASPKTTAVLHDIEKDMERQQEQRRGTKDDDCRSNASETAPLHHAVSSGRPDTATLIREAIRSAGDPSKRVLVAACGPPELMRTVRNTAARCIRGDGPGIELHCEQFGW